jgi:hypothetical protein
MKWPVELLPVPSSDEDPKRTVAQRNSLSPIGILSPVKDTKPKTLIVKFAKSVAAVKGAGNGRAARNGQIHKCPRSPSE